MGWSEKIHARRIFLLRGGKAGSINRSTDALVATMPRRIGQRRTGPNTTTCNRASALRRRRRRANRTKPSRSGSFCKEGAAEGVSPVPGGGRLDLRRGFFVIVRCLSRERMRRRRPRTTPVRVHVETVCRAYHWFYAGGWSQDCRLLGQEVV
jgi:hypothetical protein